MTATDGAGAAGPAPHPSPAGADALITFNRPYATGREFAYIEEAIGNRHLSGNGPFAERCARWLEQRTGGARVLLTGSGTQALELAAILAGVRPGDEVIMPSFTFVSTASAVALRGAVPVFVDIRPDTLNLDERLLADAVTERTRAIVPVHYAGVACEMEAILRLAADHQLIVIEDAAQGMCASYQERSLGGIGDLGCFSFHETKNVHCGEGGALILGDASWSERAEILQEKGTNRHKFSRGEVPQYTWLELGSSFLLSEVNAAYLWAQLEAADEITQRRLELWNAYHERFAKLEDEERARRPVVPPGREHNGHEYYLLVDDREARDRLIADLRAAAIQAVFHYVPLHSSPAGRRLCRAHGKMTVTERVSQRLVRLPLWIGMSEREIERVTDAIETSLRRPARSGASTTARSSRPLEYPIDAASRGSVSITSGQRFRVFEPRLPAPFRVLVFPSINEPGLEIVQALAKSNKVRLLGGSSLVSDWDPSRLLLEDHLRCPSLTHPDFRASFESLLQTHGVDLVFPTTDALVAEFSTWEGAPSRFLVTTPESAQVCLSKRLTYARLAGTVPLPRSYEGARTVDLPAFAKPDIGSGSRRAFRLDTETDLNRARAAHLVIQEYLPGPEYTVDCLSDLSGSLMLANPRVRGLVGRGIALGTATVDQTELASHVAAIGRALKIVGPWFAQFKLDSQGCPKLIEVNARVPGSMVLTRLAGINVPLLSVFLFAGWPVQIPMRLDGTRVVRHLRSLGELSDFDWVIWDLDDTLVRSDGKADPDVVARLYDFQNQGKSQLLVTSNQAMRETLARLHLPSVFVAAYETTDKLADLPKVMAEHDIDPARCVVINDSFSENSRIRAQLPGLRTITPDALDVLAREKLH